MIFYIFLNRESQLLDDNLNFRSCLYFLLYLIIILLDDNGCRKTKFPIFMD